MTDRPTDPEYAFWSQPGSPLKVVYDLGIFHEIDFIVNEAFRRIPHGGIEVGGILLGRSEPEQIRIEAFRMIECEHASGPSFNLSDRDLAKLQEQLAGLPSDPELEGLEVVGWFIAHTRNPLKLNDRETKIFNDLFPGTGKLAILIKPERFQPTRFAFFVRTPGEPLEADGTRHAIILPNAGRGGSADAPIPSIPAPIPKPPLP